MQYNSMEKARFEECSESSQASSSSDADEHNEECCEVKKKIEESVGKVEDLRK